jgi:hypothetical protein
MGQDRPIDACHDEIQKRPSRFCHNLTTAAPIDLVEVSNRNRLKHLHPHPEAR